MPDIHTLVERRRLLKERIENTEDPYLRENLLQDYYQVCYQIIQLQKGNKK